MDSWVLDTVVKEWGNAPDAVIAGAERLARNLGLKGTKRGKEIIRYALRFHRRASLSEASAARASAGAAARGLQQRRNAAAAGVVRYARADREVIAFRTAYDLPIKLDGTYEPFKGAAIARAWGALPRPALYALAALESQLETLIGWTRDQARRFVLADEPPESLPWRAGPLVEALLAVSLDQYNQYAFVMNRKQPGVTWLDLSREWDRMQAPGERYGGGVGYKQFYRDVKRTEDKLQRHSMAKEVVRRLLVMARADEREAAARVAGGGAHE